MENRKAIYDCLTHEMTFEDFTLAELAEFENAKAKAKSEQLEKIAKEAARQSALDKLAALGLTPEEISAITGS